MASLNQPEEESPLVRVCESCGERYFVSEGCPNCVEQKCSSCGGSYKGQSHSCPVCTGRHYQRDDPDDQGDPNDVPHLQYRIYRRWVQPSRRLLEHRFAAYWPTSLFEFSPVQRTFLEDCIEGTRSPTSLSDLRAIRWLIPRMEKLDFQNAKSVERKCLRHLVKSNKDLVLTSLDFFDLEDTRLLAKHRGKLYVRPPTPLTEEIAKELARHRGKLLSLRKLIWLEPAVASRLAMHRGELQIHGLHTLSLAVAEQLKCHRGTCLRFPSVTRLSVSAAAEIAQYVGEKLYFSAIDFPSPELQKALDKFRGTVKFGKFGGRRLFRGLGYEGD